MDEARTRDFEPVRAVVALGSNLPDRREHLKQGLGALRDARGVRVVCASGVYESEPVGEGLTGWFLNACVVFDATIAPGELLELCQEIEKGEGRDRTAETEAGVRDRTLDLDIIFYGDCEQDGPRLALPHPRWHERAFVVLPLLDVREHLTEHQRRLLDLASENLNLDSESCRKAEKMLN